MRIVIVGYGEMLRALVAGVKRTNHELVGVFRHDNVLLSSLEKMFNDNFSPSSDCVFVKSHKLYDIKAKSVNSDEFREEIARLKADLIIVGSWSEKFSIQTINVPRFGCVNVHPSLLPKYRGPNPYMQVILNAEEKTGITFHLMDVNYDTGAILHQAEIDVSPTDTGKTLKLRCCDLAKKEVVAFLTAFKKKFSNPISQNEKEATYFNQLDLKEVILNFEKETAEQIDRRIRALTPWLKCVIPYQNQFIEFNDYKLFEKPCDKEAGSIIKMTSKSIFIVCADKKVIEFANLKLKSPLLKVFSSAYIKKHVKINSKAL